MVDDRGQAVGLMLIGLLCRLDLYTVSFGYSALARALRETSGCRLNCTVLLFVRFLAISGTMPNGRSRPFNRC